MATRYESGFFVVSAVIGMPNGESRIEEKRRDAFAERNLNPTEVVIREEFSSNRSHMFLAVWYYREVEVES